MCYAPSTPLGDWALTTKTDAPGYWSRHVRNLPPWCCQREPSKGSNDSTKSQAVAVKSSGQMCWDTPLSLVHFEVISDVVSASREHHAASHSRSDPGAISGVSNSALGRPMSNCARRPPVPPLSGPPGATTAAATRRTDTRKILWAARRELQHKGSPSDQAVPAEKC